VAGRPVQPLPPRPVPPPSRAGQERTAIIPPSPKPPTSAGPPATRDGLSRGRIAALVAAGVLVLGGGAAFAVSQLTSDDGGSSSEIGAGGGGSATGGSGGDGARAIDPADVTVAVLNGTLVPGLAASIGDDVERQGFDLGTLGNTDDQEQQRAESVVMYARGHAREAALVSRKLKIAQREAIDPQTQSLAGDAAVVVVAGGDQTP
jgi:hypothetical protein